MHQSGADEVTDGVVDRVAPCEVIGPVGHLSRDLVDRALAGMGVEQ
jgi:hypothetical protein